MLRSLHRLAVMTALCVASVLVSMPATASVPCEIILYSYPSPEVTTGFVAQRPDGSFSVVAYDNDIGKRRKSPDGKHHVRWYSGGPAIDVGGGRVGQVVSGLPLNSCPNESLLFIDCNVAEGILLDGRGKGISPYPYARQIQPPYGPIGLTKTRTVDQLAKIAEKHQIAFTRDLSVMNHNVIKRMRINPYQGCKIFYPDSPGARR